MEIDENSDQILESYACMFNSCLSSNFSRFFLSSADFFQSQLFQKILAEIPSECQTVLIQIRPDILSGLIWVNTVCKEYQQGKLGDKELKSVFLHMILWAGPSKAQSNIVFVPPNFAVTCCTIRNILQSNLVRSPQDQSFYLSFYCISSVELSDTSILQLFDTVQPLYNARFGSHL